MIIGFDGKRAINNLTGLGNYSRLVIESIACANWDSTIRIYAPRMRHNSRLEHILSMPNVEICAPEYGGLKGAWWRSWGITKSLKQTGVQIFHGLSNELPLNINHAGVPSVVTIHDVIYRKMPDCYKLADRLLYDYKYGHSVRAATRVIAISECTKRDIIELYNIPPHKIDVVYQGCDNAFKSPLPPTKLEQVRLDMKLPDRYILQVGTVEKRKNLELTIRAFSALPQDISLVVVGRDNNGYLHKMKTLADSLGVSRRVLFLDNVTFANLPAIYSMAEIVTYPSFYEGFGIPILEALESCVPVIAATGSCLEEAGGNAAIYVPPTDVRAMTQAMKHILDTPEEKLSRTAAGKQHASRFNHETMTDAILLTYTRAIADYSNTQLTH